MRIDVHSHLCPEEIPDYASAFGDARWPMVVPSRNGTRAIVRSGQVYREIDDRYWGVARRLEYLDRYGIDVQAVSPLPVLLPAWAPAADAAAACSWLNEAVAAFVASRPDRFVGLGTVALHAPDSVEPTLRQVRELGLAGVEIGTVHGGFDLGSDVTRQFFDLAAAWDVAVLVHPLEGAANGDGGRMTSPAVRFSVGVTTDTALAASSLMLAGGVDTLPRLCLAHGGGSYYWTRPRLQQVLATARGADVAAEVFRVDPFWIDTAMVGAANLRYLADCVDRRRVLIGSDYPATAALDPCAALVEVGWHEDADVTHRNAQAFLARAPR